MLKFKQQILRESNEILSKVNDAVNTAAEESWQVAVNNTPGPPSATNAKYKRTGRLKAGWKLNTGRNVGLIPAFGNYKEPARPTLNFDIRKHSNVMLWNNVPYAPHVNDGLGGGNRVPHKMIEKAEAHFETRLNSMLGRI